MQGCRNQEGVAHTENRWQSHRLAMLLAVLVSACSAPPSVSGPRIPSADEALAVQSRVTDCEWNAAARYDDGRRTLSALAQQVMDVCTVERTKAALAFGLSPNDPQVESDQFRQAVENVEAARKARKNSN